MNKPRKLDCNQEVKRLQQLLGRKLRLHAEAELQHRERLETDKVLCDLLLHHEFFEQMFAALRGELGEEQSKAYCALGQQLRGALQRAGTAGASGAAAAAGGGAAGANTTSGGMSAMGNHLHRHDQQDAHEVLLPDSYVARLLRQATDQQLQQVLQMTTEDWVQYFSDLFPQLLAQLEVCTRAEYDYDATSMAAASPVGPSTPRPGSAHTQGLAGFMHSDTVNNSIAPGPSAAAAAAVGAPGVRRPGSGSGQWCWQHQPLGTSPVMDRRLLAQTMDRAVQLVQLASVLNPVPFFEACGICLSSRSQGQQGQPGPQHWEAVADRLGLSETQQLHISICMTEVKRSNVDIRAKSNRLLQCTEQPTLQLAAALQQEQQRQQQQRQQEQQQEDPCQLYGSSKKRNRCASMLPSKRTSGTVVAYGCSPVSAESPPADDQELSGSWQDCLGQRMQQLMRKRQVQQLCVQSLIFNTLTRHQLSVVDVASFPYVPALFNIAEVCSTRLQQRQLQHLGQLEDSVCMKRTGAAGVARANGHGMATHKPSEAAAAAAAAAANAASHQAAAVPYSQWLLQQHEQQRDAELVMHQRACWSQLECLQEELQKSTSC